MLNISVNNFKNWCHTLAQFTPVSFFLGIFSVCKSNCVANGIIKSCFCINIYDNSNNNNNSQVFSGGFHSHTNIWNIMWKINFSKNAHKREIRELSGCARVSNGEKEDSSGGYSNINCVINWLVNWWIEGFFLLKNLAR